MMPESTSPMPPLAMPGLPVGDDRHRVRPGVAITVRAPFRTTTPCSRSRTGARVATRSACTSAVVIAEEARHLARDAA